MHDIILSWINLIRLVYVQFVAQGQSANLDHGRGDHIIIMTARGSGSKKDWRKFTEKQLLEFGIQFDELIVGLKPGGVDFFVDDKAINALDWMADEERAMSRVETKEHKKDIQIFDPYFPYAKEILDKLGVNPEDYKKNRSDD